MNNKDLETAIVRDYQQLSSIVERLETRLELYTGYIGSGRPGRQDAYCSAKASVQSIAREIKKLKTSLEKM